ncbi:hypothetical protein FRC03_007517 [Tulasnella sp. 419]|nr:hypothetical protein FRC03_007517 [Tulasnella sp. 419]
MCRLLYYDESDNGFADEQPSFSGLGNARNLFFVLCSYGWCSFDESTATFTNAHIHRRDPKFCSYVVGK